MIDCFRCADDDDDDQAGQYFGEYTCSWSRLAIGTLPFYWVVQCGCSVCYWCLVWCKPIDIFNTTAGQAIDKEVAAAVIGVVLFVTILARVVNK